MTRPVSLPFVSCFGLFLLACALPGRAEQIEVASKPVPLNPADPKQGKVGGLTFRGGLALTSAQPSFGGLSGLRLSEDGGRVTFITDEGSWLTARLVHDPHGDLVGLTDAEMGRLLGPDGRPLLEKEAADAEGLARLADGSMVVGFEHQHRLLRYPAANGRLDGTPRVVAPPPGLEQAPANGGIEALIPWDDGGFLALTEYWVVDQVIRGWWGGPDRWRPLGYRFDGAFRPSDLTRLPSGDVVVLERAYNPARGIVAVRLRRVAEKAIKAGARIGSKLIAELGPPLTVDNFEGIDAVRGPKGETFLYLVSDDNFRAGDQRTLLLMFALDGK
jgi:hypothetical protein